MEGYSLISRQENTFTVHRVAQEVVQSRIPTERRREWLAASLQIVNDYSPAGPDDVRTWAVWDLLRPHAKLVATLADEAGITEPTARLFTRLASLLCGKGLYSEAEPMMRRAFDIDELAYGKQHPKVARDLNNLAALLKATNRLAEAGPMMRRAVEIWERSLGLDHPSTKRGQRILAFLLEEISAQPLSPPPDHS